MKETIKNKGITLIVLMITIILLLILAGITIATLSNSGLFEKSKLAKEKWTNSIKKDEDILNNYSNEIDTLVDGSVRNQTFKKVLFDGNQSSGTITFPNDKFSDYTYIAFIYGILGFETSQERTTCTMLPSDYFQYDMTTGGCRYLCFAPTIKGLVSIAINNLTENSLTFTTSCSGDSWKTYTGYIYKIIGIK